MMLADVATALQTAGVGTKGTDIFQGEKPATPDNLVALFEYGGSPPPLTFTGTKLEEPGLNVWIRNKVYPAGREKAQAVFDALHGNRIAATTGRILLMKANQSPEGMGKDESGRHEWVINFTVIKEVG